MPPKSKKIKHESSEESDEDDSFIDDDEISEDEEFVPDDEEENDDDDVEDEDDDFVDEKEVDNDEEAVEEDGEGNCGGNAGTTTAGDSSSALPSWIDMSNIVTGKRTRKPTGKRLIDELYEDPALQKMMLEGVGEGELKAALEDEDFSQDEEDDTGDEDEDGDEDDEKEIKPSKASKTSKPSQPSEPSEPSTQVPEAAIEKPTEKLAPQLDVTPQIVDEVK